MCERGTHKLAIHTMPNPNLVTIIIWPKQTHQTYTTPNSPKMLDKNKLIPARHSLSSPSDSEMIWCIWFVFLVMINKITLGKKTPKVQFLLFWGWRALWLTTLARTAYTMVVANVNTAFLDQEKQDQMALAGPQVDTWFWPIYPDDMLWEKGVV